MQFHFFHLMPWPHLPDDFEQRYESAWVTAPNHLFEPERGAGLYQRYIDELAYADELGFDGAINYKTENVLKILGQHCLNGVDIYFDNTGGDILQAALFRMNQGGRAELADQLTDAQKAIDGEGSRRGREPNSRHSSISRSTSSAAMRLPSRSSDQPAPSAA